HAEDAPGLSPKRHSYADLLRAPGDSIRKHSVHANNRHQKCKGGEAGDENAIEAGSGSHFADCFVERLEIRNSAGIERVELRRYRRLQDVLIAYAPYDQLQFRRIRPSHAVDERFRSGRCVEAAVLCVGNDSDYSSPSLIRWISEDLFSDRILSGEVGARRCFVNYRERIRMLEIVVREEPSTQNADSGCPGVACACAAYVDVIAAMKRFG